jgi:hypothetical protein
LGIYLNTLITCAGSKPIAAAISRNSSTSSRRTNLQRQLRKRDVHHAPLVS